jgi:hypothetical protein
MQSDLDRADLHGIAIDDARNAGNLGRKPA